MKEPLRNRLWRKWDSRATQMGRLMLLAALVGCVSGLGAVAFNWLSHTVVSHALVGVAGYDGGGPAGELGGRAVAGPGDLPFSPLGLLAVIVCGGLFSGLVVFTFAPEAEGHGTDAAIDAYHNKRGIIRPRVPLIKMLTSAVTIGTGGSGGREGPIAQIGAGFGSMLASRLRLSDYDRRVLLAAGMGAGVGAIFRAPLAGAIFAIEVLYIDPDFEAEALIPSLISTSMAYCVFGLFYGFRPLFDVKDVVFDNPALLGPLTILAGVMAGASLLYVRCFYGMTALFRRMRIPPHIRPAIGALLAALVALGAYYAFAPLGRPSQHLSLSMLSFGYGVLQDIFSGKLPGGLGAALGLLAVIGLGKIVTTSLTIGSGGSGGVFGPSMVIGGTLGAAVGLLLQQWMPGVVTRVDVFAILGMASFFSSAAKTPISTLIIVTEMTASYELLLPAMWVCALGYLVSRPWTIYSKQVGSRLDSPAHRGDFLVDVLEGLTVADAWKGRAERMVCVPLSMPLGEVVRLITGTTQSCFPVVDATGRYYGLFSIHDVRQFLYESQVAQLAVAQDLARDNIEPVRLDSDLSSVVSRFARVSFDELPIADRTDPGKIVGMLRRHDVIATYNAQMAQARSAPPPG